MTARHVWLLIAFGIWMCQLGEALSAEPDYVYEDYRETLLVEHVFIEREGCKNFLGGLESKPHKVTIVSSRTENNNTQPIKQSIECYTDTRLNVLKTLLEKRSN